MLLFLCRLLRAVLCGAKKQMCERHSLFLKPACVVPVGPTQQDFQQFNLQIPCQLMLSGAFYPKKKKKYARQKAKQQAGINTSLLFG